jgi:hypothetical protein
MQVLKRTHPIEVSNTSNPRKLKTHSGISLPESDSIHSQGYLRCSGVFTRSSVT